MTDEHLTLHAWLSPAFPIGAFSYSHGLEFAHEAGVVGDRESLRRWIEGILDYGAGRADAIIMAAVWRAAKEGDGAALRDMAELASSLRGSAELMHENANQGQAFLDTVRAAWPRPGLDEFDADMARSGISLALPVAVGVAAAAHGIALELLLPLYLQAFAANLVSAGVRLIPLGQTDGQRITSALLPTVSRVAETALGADPNDLGASAIAVDLCAMKHETQYTRLFRS